MLILVNKLICLFSPHYLIIGYKVSLKEFILNLQINSFTNQKLIK